MKNLVIGEKVKLNEYFQKGPFEAEVSIQAGMEIDFCCFGLDADKKLSDDRYMVFFNQKISPDGTIKILNEGNNLMVFQIDLSKIDNKIKNIVITGTVDDQSNMSKITGGYISIKQNKNELFKFSFSGSDFKNEKAIIISEIYQKDIWRLSAVGKGFDGGLSALLQHFGGEEIEETAPQPSITQTLPIQPSLPIQSVQTVPSQITQTQKQSTKPLNLGMNQNVQVSQQQAQPTKPLNLARNQNIETHITQNQPKKPLYLGRS